MYNGKVVVFSSGIFEMFHSNRLKMIEYVRGWGDMLIVGVPLTIYILQYE